MTVQPNGDDDKSLGGSDPLSNSGFCGQNTPYTPLRYLLDKVSFTIPMPSQHSDAMVPHVMWQGIFGLLKADGVHHGKSKMYHAHWTWREKFDIQFGLKNARSDDSLRFEFNPSHVSLQDLAAWAEHIPAHKWRLAKLTRCDWAADYGVDIIAARWLFVGSSAQCVYLDGYRIETLYLGKRASDRQFRIYNKLREVTANRPKPPRVRRKRLDTSEMSSDDAWIAEKEEEMAEEEARGEEVIADAEFRASLPEWARCTPERVLPEWWRVEVQDRRERKLLGSGVTEDPFAGLMARGELSGPFLALSPAMHQKGLGLIKGWVKSWGGPKCWERHWEPHIGPSHVVLPTLAGSQAVWAEFERELGLAIDTGLHLGGKL